MNVKTPCVDTPRSKTPISDSLGKTSLGEKLAYFSVNAGNAPVMSLISGFLSIYYVTVVGLDLAKVATMFLISRLFDALTDPVSGLLIDRLPAGKWGKFRPVLVFGVIICMMNYALVWFAPTWVGDGALTLKYAVAYFSYLLLGWTFDIMDIPLNSLLPVITDDVDDRRTLAVVKNMGSSVGALAVGLIGPMIIGKEGAGKEEYQILIFGGMACILILSILGVSGIKERITPKSKKKYGIKGMLKFLTVGPVISFFLVDMFVGMATYTNSVSFPYFFKYVVGDGTKQSAVSTWTYVGTVLVYIAVALGAQKKLGNRKLCAFGLFLNGICFAMRYFAADNMVLFTLLTILGTAGTFSSVLKYSIQADNTNYAEYVTDTHGEGGIASLSSFITKAGMAIGGALPGYILTAVGFNAEAGVQNTKEAAAITACASFIPGLMLIAAGLVMLLFYRLSPEELKKINEIIHLKHVEENSSK